MQTERRTLPHRIDARTADALCKRAWQRKRTEARRSQLIEAQLDNGVPLALALRIVDGGAAND